MMSSDTSWPPSITFFAATPSGVPAFTAARSMSPVEICGMPNFALMKPACVPLPAPGGPRRINLIKAGSLSCKHCKHGLQILRRVHAGRNFAIRGHHRDPVAVPQNAQLLERLGFLERRRRKGRETLEEIRAVRVQTGMAKPCAARLA